MTVRLFAPILFLTACTRIGPLPPSDTPQIPAATPSVEVLQLHNRERASVRVPPLSWDPALAAGAAVYAGQLARTVSLQHSPRSARPDQGENLWMGTRGVFAARSMVMSWLAERTRFRPGIFPAVSSTGNWADVGHYSQMIWPTTTRLGCAIASGPRVDVLVCRYAPAGNVDGRRVP